MPRQNLTQSPIIPVISPENLEKAAQLRRQIEALEAEYRRLLTPDHEATSEPSGPSTPAARGRRRGRPAAKPGRTDDQGVANAVSERPRAAGRARSVRELNHMSLREAVVRALQIAGGPQTIDGILRKLRMLHYRFPEEADPIRFLSERIYNLAGVKAIGGGHFDLVERLESPSTAITGTAAGRGETANLPIKSEQP